MHRLAWVALRGGACAGAVSLVAAYVGCSDLIVPAEQTQDSGLASDDGSFLTDVDIGGGSDGALDGGAADADARAARLECNGQDAAFGPPSDLGCTGLYSDWSKRTVSPAAKPFDPGLRVFGDGADKTRWIQLPPAQKIDTRDMNEWKFPVGTKLWAEVKIGGHRIETQHYWKRSDKDWVRTTYRWSDDELSAVARTDGEKNVRGTTYSVPTVAQCDTCHAGRVDKVLGFDAVSLSSPQSTFDGVTPAIDAVAPLLTAPPEVPLAIPDDATGKAAPALGWLHANCGVSCHNASPSAFAGRTGLFLRLEIGADGLGAYEATDAYKTAVCRASRFEDDAPAGGWVRLVPGNPGKSLVHHRGSRANDPAVQMPPIGSSIPDRDGVKLLRDWVANGAFPTQTALCQKP